MGLGSNMKSISAFMAAGALAMALVSVSAQERVDADVYWKIRREAAANSQILETVHVLTDVYGPRLTGSPNLKAAGEWAVEQMKAWGLENGRLEPWDFGHPGWANERLSAHIVSPVKDPLVAEVLAWTPGTNGPVRAAAAHITVPSRPTRDTLAAHLDPLKAAVKGKIVLVGAPQAGVLSPSCRCRCAAKIVTCNRSSPPSAAAPAPPASAAAPASTSPKRRSHRESARRQINRFLLDSGALLRINDAGRDHGQIRAFANRTYDVATAPPTVVMRNEDYGRIARLLADAAPSSSSSISSTAPIPKDERATT